MLMSANCVVLSWRVFEIEFLVAREDVFRADIAVESGLDSPC